MFLLSSFHELLNRFQIEREQSLKDKETPTSVPAAERTDLSSCLWEGTDNSVATLSPRQQSLRTGACRWGGGQPAMGTAARRVCVTGTAQGHTMTSPSVSRCAFCCSRESPANISIAWARSSADSHHFQGKAQVASSVRFVYPNRKGLVNMTVVSDLYSTPKTGRGTGDGQAEGIESDHPKAKRN